MSSESPHPGDYDPSGQARLRGRGQFTSLWQCLRLTYRYLGLWAIIWRTLTFPLRFTPLRRYLRLGPRAHGDQAGALRWFKAHGEPVTIVIPSYRDAALVGELVQSIRRTTDRAMVTIVVADDASGPEQIAALRALDGVQVIEGSENVGFAANLNRGLRAADPRRDVVVLNSDMVALPGWLACLQHVARTDPDIGIVTAKLLYRDNRIQFAGTVRNQGAPEWFDHRHRFKWTDWGPANVCQPVLAATGACMYITAAAREAVGLFDEAYPMAYEDVDYSLRVWQAGMRVVYAPWARLYHLESVTRGREVGEREQESQRVFWERWSDFFDARQVRAADGGLRVIYVTEGTGVGGGHRDIFEHLNGLADRGHHAELWSLGKKPDWFDLRVPVRTFKDYDQLMAELEPIDAIKVATWWNTAAPVWRSSVLHGIPVYFVQDIETSYYPDHEGVRRAIIASYQPEFRFMTISGWNRDRLAEFGVEARLIAPGIDLDTFRPAPAEGRRSDTVLTLGRSQPLKNLPLTLDGWRALAQPRPELCMFGIEPELATDEGMQYVTAPSDEQVNELFSTATVFVMTSAHEGFCLPALEAMATGGAVVCTDAHGNRDYCRDGENCLLVEATPAAVSGAIARLLADAQLRGRLGAAGIETARQYAWSLRIDALEAFLTDIATPRPAARPRSVPA